MLHIKLCLPCLLFVLRHDRLFNGPIKEPERDPSSGAVVIGNRSNGFKLEEGKFRLGIRKKLFTVKVVGHWNRLSQSWKCSKPDWMGP